MNYIYLLISLHMIGQGEYYKGTTYISVSARESLRHPVNSGQRTTVQGLHLFWHWHFIASGWVSCVMVSYIALHITTGFKSEAPSILPPALAFFCVVF